MSKHARRVPLGSHLLVLLAIGVAVPGRAGPVHATEVPGLRYDPAIDLPVTAAAAAVTLGLRFGYAGGKSPYAQTPEEPSGIDSWAPGRQHPVYDKLSDGILYPAMAVGLLAPMLAAGNSRWWKNALLYTEALAISLSITDLFKFAVRRPRPFTHDERTGDMGDDFSFFSGHASTTAVSLFFAARTLDLTHDLPAWARISLYLGAGAGTAVVSVLRVAAGVHYPTDVIVGAVVGGSIGFLVPQLHREQHVTIAATPIAGGGATVGLAGRFD